MLRAAPQYQVRDSQGIPEKKDLAGPAPSAPMIVVRTPSATTPPTPARASRRCFSGRSRASARAITAVPAAAASGPCTAEEMAPRTTQSSATATQTRRAALAQPVQQAPQSAAGTAIPRYAEAKSGFPSDAMIGLNGLFQLIGSTPSR